MNKTMIVGEVRLDEDTGLLVPRASLVQKEDELMRMRLPQPIVDVLGSDKAIEYCSNTFMDEARMPFLTVVDQNGMVWRLFPPVFPMHLGSAMEMIDALATMKAKKKYANAYDINITFPSTGEIDAVWQKKIVQKVYDYLGIQYVYRLSYIRRNADFYEFFVYALDKRVEGAYNEKCDGGGEPRELEN